MLNIFLALWLAIAGPAQQLSNTVNGQTGTVQTSTDPGDNGHIPPPPPPPPPLHP